MEIGMCHNNFYQFGHAEKLVILTDLSHLRLTAKKTPELLAGKIPCINGCMLSE
jgi:hypothetical protein